MPLPYDRDITLPAMKQDLADTYETLCIQEGPAEVEGGRDAWLAIVNAKAQVAQAIALLELAPTVCTTLPDMNESIVQLTTIQAHRS